jgi:hypothetical protein
VCLRFDHQVVTTFQPVICQLTHFSNRSDRRSAVSLMIHYAGYLYLSSLCEVVMMIPVQQSCHSQADAPYRGLAKDVAKHIAPVHSTCPFKVCLEGFDTYG